MARRPEFSRVISSAPCRVDCGGTLDIGPLALSLAPLQPATFNIALTLRTEVEITPIQGGGLIVESAGFPAESAVEADYCSPLGFFFLAADYFGLSGLEMKIRSASPPRSALGGSSAALVAAVAGLARISGRRISCWEVAQVAFQVEQALFNVPCGRQDHLAAAFGGVNLWTWTPGYQRGYKRRQIVRKSFFPRLAERILVAYPGQTHSSADINGTWVQGFISGRDRAVWRRINELTRDLAGALAAGHYRRAAACLMEETGLRQDLTPEVLTAAGQDLVAAAEHAGAGARFSGAGAGGCLWALGPKTAIDRLRPVWAEILRPIPEARLLPPDIDAQGLQVRLERP